jgi:ATP-binding cassette subfamily B protein
MLMQRRLGELTAAIPTIEHFERPDYLRQIDLLRQDSAALAELFAAVVRRASQAGRLALSVGLLASLHPVLAVLPLFGIPSLVAAGKAQRIRRRLDEAVAEHRRLEFHLQALAWDEAPGKELRVFGLADELVARHARTRAAVDRLEDRETLKSALITTAGWLAFAVGFVAAIGFVVAEAAAGRTTIGGVVLALSLAGQVNGSVADLAGTVSWASRSLAVAERYLWLTEYAQQATRVLLPPAPVPARLQQGITLADVSFAYPVTAKNVLEHVNLHLPAGSTVALVGENGAGKTTLVKLLCGLYQPSAGRVLVDGADLRRLDVETWRSRTSAGFQDFARFMLLVRESVGVGDVQSVEDVAAVAAALERAHAADLVAELPYGLETQLGRYFRPGVGQAAASALALSGGQWQKLALGRAMMRPEPLLLVLDEPTAALDAPSEHALFERYAGAARRSAAANGGITVLVSHRFSTVRLADRILVLEDGRIGEAGSHGDLVALGGRYAALYEMQAGRYRE